MKNCLDLTNRSAVVKFAIVVMLGSAVCNSCGVQNAGDFSKVFDATAHDDFSTGVILSERFLNFFANIPGSNLGLLPKVSHTLKKAENGETRLEVSSTEDLLRLRLKKTPAMTNVQIGDFPKSDRLTFSHTDDLNSIISSELAGRLVSSAEIESIFNELLRPTKPKAVNPPSETDLIKFSKELPVSFSAQDGKFSILLKIDEFHSGRVYKIPMNIRANYKVSGQGGNSLEKQGSVVILPQNYDPLNPRLSKRQKILIEELQDVFESSFEPVLIPSSESIEDHSNYVLSTNYLSVSKNMLVVSKRITRTQ